MGLLDEQVGASASTRAITDAVEAVRAGTQVAQR
jgi:hypothetical protein